MLTTEADVIKLKERIKHLEAALREIINHAPTMKAYQRIISDHKQMAERALKAK